MVFKKNNKNEPLNTETKLGDNEPLVTEKPLLQDIVLELDANKPLNTESVPEANEPLNTEKLLLEDIESELDANEPLVAEKTSQKTHRRKVVKGLKNYTGMTLEELKQNFKGDRLKNIIEAWEDAKELSQKLEDSRLNFYLASKTLKDLSKRLSKSETASTKALNDTMEAINSKRFAEIDSYIEIILDEILRKAEMPETLSAAKKEQEMEAKNIKKNAKKWEKAAKTLENLCTSPGEDQKP